MRIGRRLQAASPSFWNALLAAKLGPRRLAEVVAELESGNLDPLAFLRAGADLTAAQLRNIERLDSKKLRHELDRGAFVMCGDALPERLTHMPAPPIALFARGDAAALDAPTVGIVGTRTSSAYGEAAAFRFAEALSAGGVTVVSGGALGIDAAAHKGALAGGGRTVAVLGCGIDTAYPPRNRNLLAEIEQRGLLLSHFAVGTPAIPHQFRERNPIIAGLSDVLLVVEAPAKSGALTTSTAAQDIGRDVLVVPGGISQFGFRGSHQLIREGATLVSHPDHVFEALGMDPGSNDDASEVPDEYRRVVAALETRPLTIEVIAERTSCSSEEITAALTELELMGLVTRDRGGYSLLA